MSMLSALEALLKTPTAPFRENWMAETLDELLDKIPGLVVSRDRFGNRAARLRRGNPVKAPVVFVAHLDHPGFIFPDGGAQPLPGAAYRYEARFEGRVRDGFFLGSPVRLFRAADDPGVAGKIVEFTAVSQTTDDRRVVIETQEDARGAHLAMWDIPAFSQEGDKLFGRACDDLAGCAAMIEALSQLSTANEDIDVTALFTRAEESGFCGVLCLLNDQEARESLLPTGARIVSVEISGETNDVQLGGGAIIRTGDKATAFSASLTNALDATAKRLNLNARRALMDRGTCEATAFARAGLEAGGVCAPVRNYHNMNIETGKITPEIVSQSDLETLKNLIVGYSKDQTENPADIQEIAKDKEFQLYLSKGQERLHNPIPTPAK